jgi:hypothetical protein
MDTPEDNELAENTAEEEAELEAALREVDDADCDGDLEAANQFFLARLGHAVTFAIGVGALSRKSDESYGQPDALPEEIRHEFYTAVNNACRFISFAFQERNI